MGKTKDKRKSEGGEEDTSMVEDRGERWAELVRQVGPIANPLASRKLTKRIYKCIKKAQKQKQLRKGVREVQKFIRKGEKGLVVLAGDTSPIDVLSHMPVVCEEADIPYCYTPAKEDLGAACGSRRPTCMVMIKLDDDYEELYKECSEEMKGLPLPVS
jgi:ribosomal protein L7Ae-like RNA K-turn-binding protein